MERLLSLAALYTQHNDRVDLLLTGRATDTADTYASSARNLERESLTCIQDLGQQHLPPVGPVTNAVVRLKQIAYLTSGATRYLASAQQNPSSDPAQPARPDSRRGQHVRLARELTTLAPAAIVECATHIAPRLPRRARSHTTVPSTDTAQRDTLLDVARGHVIITGLYDQPGYGRTVPVNVDVLRHLEVQGLVLREPASAPPFVNGGPPRDRVRLSALGLSVLSTVIASVPPVGPPAAVPSPPTTATARARR